MADFSASPFWKDSPAGSAPGPDIRLSVDVLLASIDAILTEQVNAILHHPDFSKLERLWRGLRYLVDHIDFTQNIRLVFLNVSKDDLLADFEDAPEIIRSGLYKHVYTAEYGQFGGQPVAAIIADYAFSPGAQDMKLLQFASRVAGMAHAPFIAAAHHSFFGIASWDELPLVQNLRTLFETPKYSRWNAFRDTEDARYAVLALPGFLLRCAYGEDHSSAALFRFREEASSDEDFCWGNPAFVLAARLADSFARWRWCVNIVGPPEEGAKQFLPACPFVSTGGMQRKIATRALISEQKEFTLSEEGFMALVLRKGCHDVSFYSANSCRRPPAPLLGKAETPESLGEALSIQLPYMMLVNRLAHYIKIIQRENIGSWKDSKTLQRELDAWIGRYVTAMDDPDPVTRSHRPLRMAQVQVRDHESDVEWYSTTLKVRPHFTYMGANFTLSLTSKMEKQAG